MTAPAPLPPVAPLRVVPPRDGIDPAGAERAARVFLVALGVAAGTGGCADTLRGVPTTWSPVAW
jgi:hypothetical protein